jgi:hypothetical protein
LLAWAINIGLRACNQGDIQSNTTITPFLSATSPNPSFVAFFVFFNELFLLAGLHHFDNKLGSLIDDASLFSRSICSPVIDNSFSLRD